MARMESKITAAQVRHLLSYDAMSGVFTWRENRSNVKAGAVAGCKNVHGYLVIRLFGKLRLAHRLAWLHHYGDEGMPALLDHINGDKADNRIANLRAATKVINGQNRRTAQTNNKSSGLLGVAWLERVQKFMAYIDVGGKRRYLGLHSDKAVAHQVYLDAKRKIHEGCTI